MFGILLLVGPYLPGQVPEWVAAERQQAHNHLEARSTVTVGDSVDIVYTRCEWTVDPAVQYIEGVVTTYYRLQRGELRSIDFDLHSNHKVQSVRYRGADLDFVHTDDHKLLIDLPATLPAGTVDSLEIRYEGVPPRTGFGSFEVSSHSGTPIIWTLSQPYGARDWWPCRQNLRDKIDSIDIIVRSPSAYRTASNGLLIREEQVNNQTVCHWRHRYPIPAYLVAIGVTNYAVYSDFARLPGGDSLEIVNYVYPEDIDGARAQLRSTVDLIELYSDLFGEYPFAREKYGHAQFGFGGGMEHQTMSFLGGYGFSLQAHELAHQWFGDKVTCHSYQEIWLNEGFAHYLDGLSYNFGLGPTEWSDWLDQQMRRVTQKDDGSVFRTDTTNTSGIFDFRLAYVKGAMVLHMLRWELGDSLFFIGLRNYLHDPELAYGFATTDDLRSHLEAVSGLDLTTFFHQWIYGEGHPNIQVTWRQEGQELILNAFQTTTHPSVAFYEMRLPLEVTTTAGVRHLKLDHRFSGQEFRENVSGAVVEVVIDPDNWILAGEKRVDNLVNTAQIQPFGAWRVYPVPATHQLRVEMPASVTDRPDRMRVLDQRGRAVRRMPYADLIDISSLSTGPYWLEVRRKGAIDRRSFIKQ